MRIQKQNNKLTNHSTSLNNKNKISLKLKLAEKSWLFSIVASFIGLLSLLTPSLYISIIGYYELAFQRTNVWIYIQEWIFGYDIGNGYSSNSSTTYFEVFEPLPIHIIATTLIVISHFIILVIAAKKLKKKEQIVSPYLIYLSIVTMLTVIGYVIYFWIYLVITYKGWYCYLEQDISPGFAVYGQFISGFFVIINYYLGKTYRNV